MKIYLLLVTLFIIVFVKLSDASDAIKGLGDPEALSSINSNDTFSSLWFSDGLLYGCTYDTVYVIDAQNDVLVSMFDMKTIVNTSLIEKCAAVNQTLALFLTQDILVGGMPAKSLSVVLFDMNTNEVMNTTSPLQGLIYGTGVQISVETAVSQNNTALFYIMTNLRLYLCSSQTGCTLIAQPNICQDKYPDMQLLLRDESVLYVAMKQCQDPSLNSGDKSTQNSLVSLMICKLNVTLTTFEPGCTNVMTLFASSGTGLDYRKYNETTFEVTTSNQKFHLNIGFNSTHSSTAIIPFGPDIFNNWYSQTSITCVSFYCVFLESSASVDSISVDSTTTTGVFSTSNGYVPPRFGGTNTLIMESISFVYNGSYFKYNKLPLSTVQYMEKRTNTYVIDSYLYFGVDNIIYKQNLGLYALNNPGFAFSEKTANILGGQLFVNTDPVIDPGMFAVTLKEMYTQKECDRFNETHFKCDYGNFKPTPSQFYMSSCIMDATDMYIIVDVDNTPFRFDFRFPKITTNNPDFFYLDRLSDVFRSNYTLNLTGLLTDPDNAGKLVATGFHVILYQKSPHSNAFECFSCAIAMKNLTDPSAIEVNFDECLDKTENSPNYKFLPLSPTPKDGGATQSPPPTLTFRDYVLFYETQGWNQDVYEMYVAYLTDKGWGMLSNTGIRIFSGLPVIERIIPSTEVKTGLEIKIQGRNLKCQYPFYIEPFGSSLNCMLITLGRWQCNVPSLNIPRTDGFEVTCVVPAGYGKNLPLILAINHSYYSSDSTLRMTSKLNEFSLVSYTEPKIWAAAGPDRPTVLDDRLILPGTGFGPPFIVNDQNLSVILEPTGDYEATQNRTCRVEYLTDSVLYCYLNGDLEYSTYFIRIFVGNQVTERGAVYFNRVPNRAPTCLSNTTQANEDELLIFSLPCKDADRDPLVYFIDSLPEQESGRLYLYSEDRNKGFKGQELTTEGSQILTNKLVFQPAANWNGNSSISFHAQETREGGLQSNVSTITLVIVASSDNPTPGNVMQTEVSLFEDSIACVNLTASDVDSSHEVYTFQILNMVGRGTLLDKRANTVISSTPYVFSGRWNHAEICLVPNLNENGNNYMIVTWTALDSTNRPFESNQTLAFNVVPINDLPIAYGNQTSTFESQPLELFLSSFDPDTGMATNCEIETLPSHGFLYLTSIDSKNQLSAKSFVPAYAKVIYRPVDNYNGRDSFTYLAIDSTGSKSPQEATIIIDVLSVNTPPEVTAPKEIFIQGYTSLSSIRIDIKDVDQPDSRYIMRLLNDKPRVRLFYDQFSKTPIDPSNIQIENGTLTLYANESFPFSGGDYPTYDELNFIVFDGFGGNSTFSVKVMIKCPLDLNNNVWDKSGTACEKCPFGGICDQSGANLPTNQDGYYPDRNNSIFILCPMRSACPKGRQLSETSAYTFGCADGYQGLRCGQCKKGYFRKDYECKPCLGTSRLSVGAVIVLVLFGIAAVLGVVYLLRGIDLGFLGIMISYLQFLSLFKSFDLGWSETMLRLFRSISFLNFDVEVVSPECYLNNPEAVKLAYEVKYTLTMIAPLILFGVCLALMAIVQLLWPPLKPFVEPLIEKGKQKIMLYLKPYLKKYKNDEPHEPPIKSSAKLTEGDQPEDETIPTPELEPLETSEIFNEESKEEKQPPPSIMILNLFLLALKLMYLSLVKKSIELFDCTNEIDGRVYYDAEPDRQCYEDWWYRLLPVAVLGTIVYVAGIPSLILGLFMRRRKIIANGGPKSKIQKFILHLTYRKRQEFNEDSTYWDGVILLRKFAIVSTQLFFTKFSAFQSMILVVIFQISLLHHLYKKPFSSRTLNQLEASCLFSACTVITCGLMFYVAVSQSIDIDRKTNLALLLLITMIGSITSVFIFMLKHLVITRVIRNSFLENLFKGNVFKHKSKK